MSSQSDKKEEFRKYLDKGNVLGLLTNILTDLFEMDNKPENPCQYLYQRVGEFLNKSAPQANPDVVPVSNPVDPTTINSSNNVSNTNLTPNNVPTGTTPIQKDVTMSEAQVTANAQVATATTPGAANAAAAINNPPTINATTTNNGGPVGQPQTTLPTPTTITQPQVVSNNPPSNVPVSVTPATSVPATALATTTTTNHLNSTNTPVTENKTDTISQLQQTVNVQRPEIDAQQQSINAVVASSNNNNQVLPPGSSQPQNNATPIPVSSTPTVPSTQAPVQ